MIKFKPKSEKVVLPTVTRSEDFFININKLNLLKIFTTFTKKRSSVRHNYTQPCHIFLMFEYKRWSFENNL